MAKKSMNVKQCIKLLKTVVMTTALLFPPLTTGGETVSDNDVMYYSDRTMSANIKLFSGKTITVYLNSGEKLTGQVKSASNSLLHLEALSGQEFFDALINIQDVSAIVNQFRE